VIAVVGKSWAGCPSTSLRFAQDAPAVSKTKCHCPQHRTVPAMTLSMLIMGQSPSWGGSAMNLECRYYSTVGRDRTNQASRAGQLLKKYSRISGAMIGARLKGLTVKEVIEGARRAAGWQAKGHGILRREASCVESPKDQKG
jgi:hypothetical protein